MDAIPMVGTGAAVRQITQLIMNNDITGALTESWLVSLSFIQHPSKDMLTEIAVCHEFLIQKAYDLKCSKYKALLCFLGIS